MAATKGRKPLNIFMCQIVYTAITMSLVKHKGVSKHGSAREAINHFITNSETFTALKEGKLHNDFIKDTRDNNMIEPETGEPFTEKDLKEMELDRDRIKLEISRVVDPNEIGTRSTGYSDRAYYQIRRMCEAYEKYCIETNQPGPLPLNIIKE